MVRICRLRRFKRGGRVIINRADRDLSAVPWRETRLSFRFSEAGFPTGAVPARSKGPVSCQTDVQLRGKLDEDSRQRIADSTIALILEDAVNAKNQIVRTAVAAIALASPSGGATAGGMQTGETAGQAYAVPLPQGIYAWSTLSYGTRPIGGDIDENSLFNIPILAWSTPWTLAGARVELASTWPQISETFHSRIGGPEPASLGVAYNPFVGALLAWDLGGGFYLSVLSGGYIPIDTGPAGVAANFWVAREGVNFAYNRDGWKVAVNFNYQFQGNNVSTNLPGANDNVVYDMTLTKTLDKWEIGAVGFGSTDVNQRASTLQASQLALGGLVGYDFGRVSAQVYLTHDVYQKNLGGNETRGWLRVVVPLWSPPPRT
jgi:hypothetical protein